MINNDLKLSHPYSGPPLADAGSGANIFGRYPLSSTHLIYLYNYANKVNLIKIKSVYKSNVK